MLFKHIRLFLCIILALLYVSQPSADVYDENWVGLWIEEGAHFPEFSNFNENDSYILITDRGYVIGRTNWIGQRWGGFEGPLQFKEDNLLIVEDDNCIVQLALKVDDKDASNAYIEASDNNECGGVNVRFNRLFIKYM